MTTPPTGHHQLHETVLQRALEDVVARSDRAKRVSRQTFRYSLTTHLLERG